jgi:hypothetical protein
LYLGERSNENFISLLHWIAAFLYNQLGKTVMFCVLGSIPIIFFITARTGRYVDEKEKDED